MRKEVMELMDRQRSNPDINEATNFKFKELEGELQISGVYVRIYNQQPSFALTDPVEFCKGLIKFIHSIASSNHHLLLFIFQYKNM